MPVKTYKSMFAAKGQAKKLHGENWESTHQIVPVADQFAIYPLDADVQQPAAETLEPEPETAQIPATQTGEIPEEPELPIAPSPFGLLFGLAMGNGTPPAPPAAPEQTAQKKGSKIEQNRPEQNGLKRPSTGSTCEIIWRKCDTITAEKGTACTSGELFAALPGLNECTLRTQYARWRQFNGITGRLPGQSKTAPKASPEFQDVKDCLLARIPEANATARESLESAADPVALVAWMFHNTASF